MDPRSSGSSELILGLIKGLPVPLHGVPVDGQGLPGLMLGVEGVQGRVQGVLTLPAALLLGLGDPRLQGLLRIGDHVLQGVSSPQLLGPDRAPQYADLLPREPDNASRFNAHQHGTAVEEDLIEATDQHQGLALGVQPCEDLAGRDAAAAWTKRWTVDRAGAALAPITPARKFRVLLHTNPTRERGECLGTRAGASKICEI